MQGLSEQALTQVAQYFSALSEPNRLRILNCLRDGELNVGELAERQRLFRADAAWLNEFKALKKKIDEYKPHPGFTWSIHLDGDKGMHDKSVSLDGVYETAIEAIKLAKSKGFRVSKPKVA